MPRVIKAFFFVFVVLVFPQPVHAQLWPWFFVTAAGSAVGTAVGHAAGQSVDPVLGEPAQLIYTFPNGRQRVKDMLEVRTAVFYADFSIENGGQGLSTEDIFRRGISNSRLGAPKDFQILEVIRTGSRKYGELVQVYWFAYIEKSKLLLEPPPRLTTKTK